MQRLFILRHGETANNKDGKARGWNQSPLDKDGILEAHKLGKMLRGKNFDGIISSDLNRAKKTAQIVSQESKKPLLKTTKNLRTWNIKGLVGKPVKGVDNLMNESAIKEPNRKVDGGESFNEFKNRVINEVRKDIKSGKNIAIVTHSKAEKVIRSWIDGGMKNNNVNPHSFIASGIKPGTLIEKKINGKSRRSNTT